MSLSVPCPECGARLRLPTEAIGKRAKCTRCGHRFVIPDPATPGATPGVLELEPETAEPADFSPAGEVVTDLAANPTQDNPFGFDSPGEAVVKPRHATMAARRISYDQQQQRRRTKWPFVIAGVVGFVILLGGVALGTALYLLLSEKPAVATVQDVPEPPPVKQPTVQVPADDLPPIPPPPGSDDVPPPPPTPPAEPSTARADRTTFPLTELPKPPDGKRTVFLPAADQWTFDVPFAAVKAVRFAATSGTVAVLWQSNPGFQGLGVQESIDLFVGGVRAGRVEYRADGYPPGPRRFDLDPAGVYAAVEAPPGKLTVFHLPTGKAVIDGVPPFPDVPAPKPFGFLAFLDETHLATQDALGVGQVWDVKAGKPKPAATQAAARTAFGPAVSHFAMSSGFSFAGASAFRFPATPAEVGTTLTPVPGLDAAAFAPGRGATAVAVDAKLTRLAAAFPTPAGGFNLLVARPDATAPPPPAEFPAAYGPADDLAFVGGGDNLAVLAGGRTRVLFVDPESRTTYAVATAESPVLAFGDVAHEKLWWLTTDPADPQRTLARSAAGAAKPFAGLLETASAARKPLPLVLTAAGIEK